MTSFLCKWHEVYLVPTPIKHSVICLVYPFILVAKFVCLLVVVVKFCCDVFEAVLSVS